MDDHSDSQSPNRLSLQSPEGLQLISEDASENAARAVERVPVDETPKSPSLMSDTYSSKSLSSITSLHEYNEMIRKEEGKANKTEKTQARLDVRNLTRGSRTQRVSSKVTQRRCPEPVVCIKEVNFIDQDTPEHHAFYIPATSGHAAEAVARSVETDREIEGRYHLPQRGIVLTSASWRNIAEADPQTNIAEPNPQITYSAASQQCRQPRRTRKKDKRTCMKSWGIIESLASSTLAIVGIIIGAELLDVGVNPNKHFGAPQQDENMTDWYIDSHPLTRNETESNVPDNQSLDFGSRVAFITIGSFILLICVCVLAFALYSLGHFFSAYVVPRLRRF